jgi:hypothetical protein
MRNRCCWNPFTEQLPSDSLGIVDEFADRYQATAVVPLFALRSLPSNKSIRHTVNECLCSGTEVGGVCIMDGRDRTAYNVFDGKLEGKTQHER